MNEPKLLQIYGFVNPNGDTLQLRLGRIKPEKRNPDDKDTGYRWSFVGKKIPMPVWSGDWFNGHPEPVMTKWLMEHGGWAKAFMIDTITNKTEVYELPKAPEVEDYAYVLMTGEGIILCPTLENAKAIRLEYFRQGDINTCIYRLVRPEKEDTGEAKTTCDRNWTPVDTGEYPDDNVPVQITYLGIFSGTPCCEGIAYRCNGDWLWRDDDALVKVEVTAWRPIGEPYTAT